MGSHIGAQGAPRAERYARCSLSIPVIQTHMISTYPSHHPPFCCSEHPRLSCFVLYFIFLMVKSSRTTPEPTRTRKNYSLSLVEDSEALRLERSIFFLNTAVDIKCWNSGNASGGPQKWKRFAYMPHIAPEKHWCKPRGRAAACVFLCTLVSMKPKQS